MLVAIVQIKWHGWYKTPLLLWGYHIFITWSNTYIIKWLLRKIFGQKHPEKVHLKTLYWHSFIINYRVWRRLYVVPFLNCFLFSSFRLFFLHYLLYGMNSVMFEMYFIRVRCEILYGGDWDSCPLGWDAMQCVNCTLTCQRICCLHHHPVDRGSRFL